MEFSAGSRRGDTTTTPQTSSNELTSEDDDDDEHRHPAQYLPPPLLGHASDHGSIYGSDDDQFDEVFDDEREPYEVDIDISSVQDDSVDPGPYYDDFNNRSRDSLGPAVIPPRRGSLAVPIPSPNSMEGRDREDSIATLRRPSRSCEALRSESRADSMGGSRYDADGLPLVSAPTSVPESDIRRRSIQKEQEAQASRVLAAPSLTVSLAPSSTAASSSSSQDATSSSSTTVVQNSVMDGFDDSWNIDPTTGIVNVDWDASEIQDIVGGIQGPRSSDRMFRRGSSSTTDSGRRLSTTSTSSDPFTKGLNKWGGQQYIDEKMRWTFVREKADRLEEHRTNAERDRHSISALFNHKTNFNQASASASSSSSAFHEYGNNLREGDAKHSTQPSKPKETQPWRGMALGSEEWWSSYSNGRYRVTRQSQQRDPDKPPQQRVNVAHHRTPYSLNKRDMSDGPSSTIHKHSKAICFSISRHYRVREKAAPGATTGRASTSSRAASIPTPMITEDKKSTNMVMLATRRVHEKFTSTNTTRKLESHGLLNENGRQSPRDLERLERLDRETRERRKKEKEKEKQRLKKEVKEREARSKDKGKAKQGSRPASGSESSAGSVSQDGHQNSMTTSSGSIRTSVDLSVRSQETGSSDNTVIWNGSRNWRDDEAAYPDDDDDDDVYGTSGRRRRGLGRTPHIEAYSTLDPETLESFAQPVKTGSIFNWTKSKTANQLPAHEIKSYIPPWPVALQTRHHNDRKGIVEDLNSSFQDVGLLPAVGEIKGSSVPPKRKRGQQYDRNHSKNSSQEITNVFHTFPSDYLFMLLPLWPGETDALSAKKFPFTAPSVPLESRKFLLLYYKPAEVPPSDAAKGKESSKKRSRSSPTSSRDSAAKANDKHILLHKFHFCARIVTYADIQGSGVRSPGVGLSVLGPLAEAVETMPTRSYIDTFQVIGLCNSRERGIEFVPEGLEKLGLTRRVPDPTVAEQPEPVKRFSLTGTEDAEEPCDTMVLLTPIGRAVVEMAWLGAMALTSFSPSA